MTATPEEIEAAEAALVAAEDAEDAARTVLADALYLRAPGAVVEAARLDLATASITTIGARSDLEAMRRYSRARPLRQPVREATEHTLSTRRRRERYPSTYAATTTPTGEPR